MNKSFKLALLGAALFVAAPAMAQVNTVPQVGVISGAIAKNTYNAVAIGLVPAATATDVFCISGSASKIVKIQEFRISGTATAAISLSAAMVTRSSLDTGGTAASTIANPANTISSLDRGNVPATSATAVLIAYTANPTIVDASPQYVRAGHVPVGITASGTAPLVWTWGAQIGQFANQLVLRGAAQQACLNLQSSSIGAGGTTNASIQWTEE